MTRSTIANNQGTGVELIYASTANLSNCTISGNNNGGISASYASFVELSNCTLTGNSSTQGGALFLGGEGNYPYSNFASITKTIIAGNRASAGAEVVASEASRIDDNGNNLFGHSGKFTAEGFVPEPTMSTIPTQSLTQLIDHILRMNGGLTRTHNLVPGSQAIDAISDGTCPPPATDQRGVARPQDGNLDGGPACDIGAVEYVPPTP